MEEDTKKIEKKSKKNKKTKFYNFIIIILCIIIVALISYIIHDKKYSKQEEPIIVEKEKEKEKPTHIEKKLSEEEVKDYLENITNLITYFGDQIPFQTKDLSNDSILSFASLSIPKNNDEFQASELSNVVEKTFGKDYAYTLEDIQCFAKDGVLYQYDSKTGIYSFVGVHGHGGKGFFRLKIYFKEAKEENDTLIIKTQILYGGYCGDTCGPISNFYKEASYNTEDSIYKVPESDIEKDDYDSVYNQYKDELPITTLILKKQSDNRYGLTEITVE